MSNESTQVAAITGGSRGIGLAIARKLVENGINVSLCARTKEDLDKAEQKLESSPGNVFTITADVSNQAECERFIDHTVEQFGGLNILVNNAGHGLFSPVNEMSAEEWESVLDVNLTGSFYTTRAALTHLRDSETGYVFFISSLAGKNTFEGASAYCASKFGLNALAECLMLEERHNGIKVYRIAPGSVDTDFSSEDKSEWALLPEDVAKTLFDVLNDRRNAHSSYIEMRPFQPPQ